MIANSPLSALQSFCLAHLEQRDVEKALTFVTDDITWFGTGAFEVVHNKDDARRLLQEEIDSMPAGYTIEFVDMSQRMLTQEAGSVFGRLLLTDKAEGVRMDCRVTACCTRAEQKFVIASLHMSLPTDLQEDEEYFPISFAEKKQREMAQANAQMTALMQNIPAGLIVHDYSPQGTQVLFFNETIPEMLGYTYDEYSKLVQEDPFGRIVEEDKPLLAVALDRLRRDGTPINCQLRMIQKSGSYLWVNLRALLSQRHGEQTRVNGVLVDITREREQNAQLQLLVDTVPGGLATYEHTKDGIKTLFFTDGVAKMVGYSHEEYTRLAAENATHLVFEQDMPLLQAQMNNLVQNNAPINCKYRVRKKDGSLCWLNLRGAASQRTQEAIHVNTVQIDITTEMEAEEQLRVREEEYRLAVLHSGKYVYRYTIANKTSYMPLETAQILGVPSRKTNVPDSLVAEGLIAPESVEEFVGFYQAISRGEKTGHAVARRKTNNGYRWFAADFTTVFNDAGEPVSAVISMEDITDQRNAANTSILDQERLLVALQSVYPMALAVNLTQNCYKLLSVNQHFPLIPHSQGEYDALVQTIRQSIHPDDTKAYDEKLSRNQLLQAFTTGQNRVRIELRQLREDNAYHWLETVALKVDNPFDDDVIAITLARLIDEQKTTEEKLRQALEITNGELAKERFYQRLVDSAATAGTLVYRCDCQPLSYVGGQLLAQFGYSQNELEMFHQNGLLGLIHPDDRETNMRYMQKCRDTLTPQYTAEYRVFKKDGAVAWVMEKATLIKDRDGAPAYLSVIMDITQQKQMEEALRISEEETKLAMAQMGKMICRYDVATRTLTMPLAYAEKHGLPQVLPNVPRSTLERNVVAQESHSSFIRFYEAILRGEKSGNIKIHTKCANGSWCWERGEFITIFDASGKPVKAIVSVEDITDRYEKELAYQRIRSRSHGLSQEAMQYYELDLTRMLLEREEGTLIGPISAKAGKNPAAIATYAIATLIYPEDREKAQRFFCRKRLLDEFAAGKTAEELELRILRQDGTLCWIGLSLDMVTDPFSGNVKGFFLFEDIHAKKTAELGIMALAETDQATQIYNKATTEKLIRQMLEQQEGNACALLIGDIDNLKDINDTLGHVQGDRAIKAIATTLKTHFRKTDIVGRVGGDEFMVFLTGVNNEARLRCTIHALTQKLALLRIGENADTQLHSSLGIAICIAGKDDFEDFYRKADRALYHVKRNGKNDFAFYEPEMERANYLYHGHDALLLEHTEWFDKVELKRLLHAVSSFFPLIISVNLTQNSYYMMEYDTFATKSAHKAGNYEELIKDGAASFHPEDRLSFTAAFSRQNLLAAHARGEKIISQKGRQLGDDGIYRWVCTDVIFTEEQNNGDICQITLARPCEKERAKEPKPL